MKNVDLISVIVPCYNVEKYIDKCLNSILNQTYNNLEIILIDDCSNDNTLNIINEYSNKYSNINVLHNEVNYGLSKTRNVGLDNSSGSYISFIDSDDYISNNYYEELIRCLKSNNADIAVCDINLVYEDKEELKKCGSNNLEDVLYSPLSSSSCNKLFKKELFDNNRFIENKINEDVSVILPMLEKYIISYTNKTKYDYVQHDNSIQNSILNDKKLDIFEQVNIALNNINDYRYKDSIIFNQICLFLFYVPERETSFSNRYRFLKKFNKKFSKNYSFTNSYKNKFLNQLSFKNKMYYKTLLLFSKIKLSLFENILISFRRLF